MEGTQVTGGRERPKKTIKRNYQRWI